jgi:soluble cytochrome b562
MLERAKAIRNARFTGDQLHDFLKELERRDWAQSKNNEAEVSRLRNPIGASMRSLARHVDERSFELVQQSYRDSSSFDDFQNAIRELISTLDEKAASARADAIQPPLETYSGVEVNTPSYVRTLLDTVAKIKVLYLTEYRKQEVATYARGSSA